MLSFLKSECGNAWVWVLYVGFGSVVAGIALSVAFSIFKVMGVIQ